MISNQYAHELPDFDFDMSEVWSLYERFQHSERQFLDNEYRRAKWNPDWGEYPTLNEIADPEIANDPYVKHLRDQINPDVLRTDFPYFQFFIMKPNTTFQAHIDVNREVALHFPFRFDDTPTEFLDDNRQTIFAHQHSVPTMLNVQRLHTVHSDHRKRVVFQFSLMIPFEELVELDRAGKLLR